MGVPRMIPRGGRILLLIVLIAAMLPLQTVSADTGPKPTMDFQFMQTFQGPTATILGGVLDQCDRSHCQDAHYVRYNYH
jgi:hypothetical protein